MDVKAYCYDVIHLWIIVFNAWLYYTLRCDVILINTCNCNYAPNFEEVEEAYWFWPVRVCVRGSHFAYGQEWLELGS